MKNYLADRKQVVKINGVCSNYKKILIEVHQGSILGPLLYITMRHKKIDPKVTLTKPSILDRIWAADSESELHFALSRQDFKLFALPNYIILLQKCQN